MSTAVLATHAQHLTHTHGLSTEGVAIAVIAALLALLCICWAVARMLTFEPHWTLSLRHAIAESGFRASAVWAEFGDWLRLGR